MPSQSGLLKHWRPKIFRAWTAAIQLKPTNGAAWSNRGTKRLQAGRWQEARADLEKALSLEAPEDLQNGPSSILLNNLGNAEGAMGNWAAARHHFLMAAQDPDPGLSAMYQLNYSLGAFQEGDAQAAVQGARSILRRDPFFLDARAALAAFLWARGDRSEAEGEWEALQQTGDGFGSSMYNKQDAVERVRPRWPPRATAALKAFLSLSTSANAQDYDGQQVTYRF